MSDFFIIVVPADPAFVPSEDARRAVERLTAEVFPDAVAVELRTTRRVEMVWAGSNHTPPSCPFCDADLEEWFWAELRRAPKQDAVSLAVTLPCCGRPGSLNDLAFAEGFPEAFARFQLSVMNPGVGRVGDDLVRQFAEAFGCPVKIVYRRL
jgi:hypothetical protein